MTELRVWIEFERKIELGLSYRFQRLFHFIFLLFIYFYTLRMQMMAKIIGVTHIFIDQVPKFNYFSILQKGKGVDCPLPWDFASKTLDARNRLLRIETFRFKNENDYDYEIWLKVFSRILKI